MLRREKARRGQNCFPGNPGDGCDLRNPDFTKFAQGCGGGGIAVERPEEMRPAPERALSSELPTVFEEPVDPFDPPNELF